jgi:hypothetical protein
MADPGEINYRPLSASPNGDPVLVSSVSIATPTVAHQHPGGTADGDLPTLLVCNTDTVKRQVTVLVYTGVPTAANIVAIIDLLPNGGALVALDGVPYMNSARIVGLYADLTNKVTFFGRVGRATA